jgi:hypothetical protein
MKKWDAPRVAREDLKVESDALRVEKGGYSSGNGWSQRGKEAARVHVS